MALKIGVFGGAFDPPTIGHAKVAKNIVESGVVDKVWLMPCFHSYYDKKMAPPTDRIKMCEYLINDLDLEHVHVSSFEIDNKLKLETIDILKKLMVSFPNYQFYFIIGMDNANRIISWDNWDKLVDMLPFIIIPRGGYVADDSIDWYRQSPHIYLDTIEPVQISSTEVRHNIKNRQTVKSLTSSVYKHACKLNVYN